MSRTIIYEITAIVQTELIEQYEKYMRERHIPELLATGYFRGAKFTRSKENRYRIQYEARDRESLEHYLQKDAARLRGDFNAHFPEGAEVFRENWEVLQIWSVEP
jgi:hypothetical protein